MSGYTCPACGRSSRFGGLPQLRLHIAVSHSGGTPIAEVRATVTDLVPDGFNGYPVSGDSITGFMGVKQPTEPGTLWERVETSPRFTPADSLGDVWDTRGRTI